MYRNRHMSPITCHLSPVTNANRHKPYSFYVYVCTDQCESGKGLWLQALAASLTHSFGDADLVIPPIAKKNHEIFPKQLRPDINTSLST